MNILNNWRKIDKQILISKLEIFNKLIQIKDDARNKLNEAIELKNPKNIEKAMQEFQESVGSEKSTDENKKLLELARNRIDDIQTNGIRSLFRNIVIFKILGKTLLLLLIIYSIHFGLLLFFREIR